MERPPKDHLVSGIQEPKSIEAFNFHWAWDARFARCRLTMTAYHELGQPKAAISMMAATETRTPTYILGISLRAD